jgi:hypothetical protein
VYFNIFQGHDDKVDLDFAFNFQNIRNQDYITIIKGMEIQLNEVVVTRVLGLPMSLSWVKEDR